MRSPNSTVLQVLKDKGAQTSPLSLDWERIPNWNFELLRPVRQPKDFTEDKLCRLLDYCFPVGRVRLLEIKSPGFDRLPLTRRKLLRARAVAAFIASIESVDSECIKPIR